MALEKIDTETGELIVLPMPPKPLFRVRDLPEEEQKPFKEYLSGHTVPFIEGVPDDDQDGYYIQDYNSWKNKRWWF